MSTVRTTCALALCAIVLAPATVSANTIYRECFGNPDVGAQAYRDPGLYGWQCHEGGFGRPLTAYTGGARDPDLNYQMITNEPGRPQDAAAVASGPCESQQHGFWTLDNTGADPTWRALVWTDEFTVDRDLWPAGVISWHQAATKVSSHPAESRVALRIDDAWYVTTQIFTAPDVAAGDFDATPGAERRHFLFKTDAEAWRPLDFTPDAKLQLTLETQLADELPDGDITAFGLYVNTNIASYVAMDSFTVAAPEPGTMALVGAGLGALLVTRRRQPRR